MLVVGSRYAPKAIEAETAMATISRHMAPTAPTVALSTP